MIRITLIDGTTTEIARSEARAVLPFAHVFSSSQLRAPIEGIICHKGKPLPILGPMPSAADFKGDMDHRPWLLILKDHAQVIRGLPDFGKGTAKIFQLENTKKK